MGTQCLRMESTLSFINEAPDDLIDAQNCTAAVGMAMSVGSPFWSSLKCLNNCWMDCIAMKFDTDIHVLLRMNCNFFGDPSTFHLVSSGQFLICAIHWFMTKKTNKKLKTLPSAKAVLCA